jgi:hypothetical protein
MREDYREMASPRMQEVTICYTVRARADYHGGMRMAILPLLLLVLTLLPGLALAQHAKGKRGPDSRPAPNMSQQERQRLRQDVDSARGNYQRRDPRRQDRMPAEEREKLRRDVQDANRDITRR